MRTDCPKSIQQNSSHTTPHTTTPSRHPYSSPISLFSLSNASSLSTQAPQSNPVLHTIPMKCTLLPNFQFQRNQNKTHRFFVEVNNSRCERLPLGFRCFRVSRSRRGSFCNLLAHTANIVDRGHGCY